MQKLQFIRDYVAIVALLVALPAYSAERAPSEEERIAPLISKQNCWGGVIKFVPENHKFEVEDALCADGSFYHLEFDEELRLVEKRFIRKALAK
jgi:hypothetical protein